MKATLFAAVLLAASAGAALAGEGGGDAFEQSLPGIGRTYTLGAAAPARLEAPVPAYARPLPSQGNMTIVQTPNSLPPGFSGQGAAQGRHS